MIFKNHNKPLRLDRERHSSESAINESLKEIYLKLWWVGHPYSPRLYFDIDMKYETA